MTLFIHLLYFLLYQFDALIVRAFFALARERAIKLFVQRDKTTKELDELSETVLKRAGLEPYAYHIMSRRCSGVNNRIGLCVVKKANKQSQDACLYCVVRHDE